MTWVRQWLLPGVALAGLWWLLSDGATDSWLVGLPSVALALWLMRDRERSDGIRFSPLGLLRFLPFFVAESVRGGVDVVLRTLAPRPRVAPGMVGYRMRLRTSHSRLLFTNCVGLLPGTLAAELKGDRLNLHLLDAEGDPAPELRRLERRVAAVFHESL